MVVAVLITSCHVSLNLKSGPVKAQTTISRIEAASAHGVPSASVTPSETSRNRSTRLRSLSSLRALRLDRPLDRSVLRVAMLPPCGPMPPASAGRRATRHCISRADPAPPRMASEVFLGGYVEGHAPLHRGPVGDAPTEKAEPVVRQEHREAGIAGTAWRQGEVPGDAVCLPSTA